MIVLSLVFSLNSFIYSEFLLKYKSAIKLLLFKQSMFRICVMLLVFLLKNFNLLLLWSHNQVISVFLIILWIMEARASSTFRSLWSLMNFFMLKFPHLLFFRPLTLPELFIWYLVNNFPRTAGNYKLLFLLFSVCFTLWIFGAVETLYSYLQ